MTSLQSTLSKTDSFGTGTKCPSYRESNKRSKERQGQTLSVRFTEVSVLQRRPIGESRLFYCLYPNLFWKTVEQYYLTIAKGFEDALCLRDVIIGITMSSCHSLNYVIMMLIGYLCLWDCRKNQVLTNIEGFKFNVNLTFNYISTTNNKIRNLLSKMTKRPFSPLIQCVNKIVNYLLLYIYSVFF